MPTADALVLDAAARVDPAPLPDRRVRAFDVARGLAVVFMVLVHVLGHYGNDAAWASPLGQLVIFLGGPTAAPVFMFLMGASLTFSRRATPAEIAGRGLWLLGLAYSLNLARGVVPASLGLATGVVTEADIAPYTPSAMLTLVDIHQMAGLALLGMAGLVWLSGRMGVAMRWIALGAAAAVALVAPRLWGLVTGQPAVDVALALLWGTEWNVFFPLFPWAAYPLVGYAYGHAVVSGADRRLMVRRLAGAGLVAGLVGLGLILATDPVIGVGDYWRQRPGIVLAILGLIIAWLGLADVVGARLRESGAVLGLLTRWSHSVTAMYCTHWILIGWGVGLVGHRRLDLPAVALAMIVVLLATDQIVRRWPFGPGRRASADSESASLPVPATPTA